MKKSIILLFFLLSYQSYCKAYNISPIDFGLSEANTGEERYNVLLRTHLVAAAKNCGVTYNGIESIDIDIPKGAGSIPLSDYTDFAGVTINVNNNQRDLFLFSKETILKDISLSKTQLANCYFEEISELRKGLFLLCIEDQNPWVEKRTGYDYGATRRDILLIQNGNPRNQLIQPYSNEASAPKFRYCKVTYRRKVFKNLIFNRMEQSTFKTYLIKITGQNNVLIDNITINTPETENMYADYAISIQNSTNIQLEDVTINGTYSQKQKFGYGISLNNVWNSRFLRINATANWGIFGNNNVNYVRIENCILNRFDIHCYGKDVKSVNCKFSGLYNQFSSIYGTVSFEKCIFADFIPILMEPSYNAYTPYDIVFKNCTFNLSKKRNYLFTFSELTNVENTRPELRQKCMPNIIVRDCIVNIADDVKDWNLVRTGEVDYTGELDYGSLIIMKNVKVNGEAKFILSTSDLKTSTTQIIKIDIRK